MRIDLSGAPISPPAPPAGIRRVNFIPARHARPARDLLNTAFRPGGGQVEAFDAWWARLKTDAEYDPALCVVLLDGRGDLVGFAHCWSGGFIKDIAVAEAWRRKGLGRTLIETAMAAFARRGLTHVEVKLASDNPYGAGRFYERMGFTRSPDPAAP